MRERKMGTLMKNKEGVIGFLPGTCCQKIGNLAWQQASGTQPASMSNWPGSGPNLNGSLVMPNTFFVISGTMGLTCPLLQKIDTFFRKWVCCHY